MAPEAASIPHGGPAGARGAREGGARHILGDAGDARGLAASLRMAKARDAAVHAAVGPHDAVLPS